MKTKLRRPPCSHSDAIGPVLPCPGLKVTTNCGVSFTDTLNRVYDLEREKTMRPKEAARDPRMAGASTAEILRLVARGELYPVMRRNARVILLFDCALTHWRARQLTSQPLRHLVAARAQQVA